MMRRSSDGQVPRWSQWLVLGLIAFGMIGCNPKVDEGEPTQTLVPVTVVECKSLDWLTKKARLTGSVMPWKQETLTFQIAGRLETLFVLEPGKYVEGDVKDEGGVLKRRGQVLAMLNKRPYELARDEAEAQLKAAQSKLEAAKLGLKLADQTIDAARTRVKTTELELKQIFPLDEDIARYRREFAVDMHRRRREASDGQNNAQIEEARTNELVALAEEKKVQRGKMLKENELDLYRADLAKAEASKELNKAEEKVAEASVTQAQAIYQRALEDIEKCILYVPFSGVIAKVMVNPGMPVDATTPIAMLVMMDPIRVDMSVSLKRLKDFYYGEQVMVFPFGKKDKRKEGMIYHIQTSADPATRTFLATAVLRNYQERLDRSFESETLEITDFSIVVVQHNPSQQERFYVDTRSIGSDEKGYFVWKISNPEGEEARRQSTIHQIRLPKLGEGQESYINVVTWLFREIVEPRPENLPYSPTRGAKDPTRLWESDTLILNPPRGLFLFKVDLQDQGELGPGKISAPWRQLFESRGKVLAPEATVEIKKADQEWVIRSGANSFWVFKGDHDFSIYEPLRDKMRVAQMRKDWLFHPGELVEVQYDYTLRKDLYLPSAAILSVPDRSAPDGKSHAIFVVDKMRKNKDGKPETGVAYKKKVQVEQQEGDLYRVSLGEEGAERKEWSVVIHGLNLLNERYGAREESEKEGLRIRISKLEEFKELFKDYLPDSKNPGSGES